MSRIEEFFEKSVNAGIIPQIPMNYDAVSYKIYTGYLENKIDGLTAENQRLREEAAEQKSIAEHEHATQMEWFGRACEYAAESRRLTAENAELRARLKELKGGER